MVRSFAHAPIALTTALRETSIPFAMAIGVLFLEEQHDPWKLVSTFVALVGAAFAVVDPNAAFGVATTLSLVRLTFCFMMV